MNPEELKVLKEILSLLKDTLVFTQTIAGATFIPVSRLLNIDVSRFSSITNAENLLAKYGVK
jgi:hypothetical protein